MEDPIDVRLEIDSKIAAYPGQMEAPSFRKTRAFVWSKAAVWLDGEYAVRDGTKRRMFGGVECRWARARTVVRPPTAGASVYPSASHTVAKALNFAPIKPAAITQCICVPS